MSTSDTLLDRPNRRPGPALRHETAETVAFPPTEDGGADPGASTATASASLGGNLAAALDADEAGRMRVFSLVVVGIAAMAIVAVLLLGGHPVVQAIHLIGASTGGIAALVTYACLRGGRRYTVGMNTLFGIAAVSAVVSGYFYWGVYSAVLLLLPFGAFIFATTRSLASALVIALPAYLLHAVASFLIAFEVIPDHSLIRPVSLSRAEHVTVILVIQGIFLAALFTARGARKSTETAVRELERAVRTLSLRDQLLAEAREELVRALALGGPGRYTDQRLGNFDLGAVIGRGAMGEVYAATHRDDGAEAAVKVMHADAIANAGHVRRFLRELDLVASVRSPHVVRVLEVASVDQGLPYLAMERLRGRTLAATLQPRGVLPVDTVAEMVRHVGSGLEQVHAAGVVHRDIKPQNIFYTDEGTWKILDFGVGTLVDNDTTAAAGRLVGTPTYMSPEQVRGQAVNFRSDLYALAAVAYRALTGRSPAAGKDVMAILHTVANERPPRPTALRPALPVDVDLALAIGLSKQPSARFDNGAELADALTEAGRGQLSTALRLRALELDTFE